MTLTRRATAAAAAAAAEPRDRSGSTIWDDQANQYWQTMEPIQRKRGFSSFIRLLLVVAVLGGLSFGAYSHLDTLNMLASSLKTRLLLPSATESMNTTSANTAPSPQGSTSAVSPRTDTFDPVATEQLRSRCRVRGVQTRWHEETCRKMCLRDAHQSACMNGCSYGSITVTKLACDDSEPAGSQCPEGVSCAGACRAYDHEKPFPAMRNACERGCANVVPSACARVLQIRRDLARGAIQ